MLGKIPLVLLIVHLTPCLLSKSSVCWGNKQAEHVPAPAAAADASGCR